MIYNLIDRRTKPYKWRHVYAIIEPTWHDNAVKSGGDHIDGNMFKSVETDYDERVHISLHDAILWAERLPYAITLYIYDDGAENIVITYSGDTIRVSEAMTQPIRMRRVFNPS